jgi:hypothetical protein
LLLNHLTQLKDVDVSKQKVGLGYFAKLFECLIEWVLPGVGIVVLILQELSEGVSSPTPGASLGLR